MTSAVTGQILPLARVTVTLEMDPPGGRAAAAGGGAAASASDPKSVCQPESLSPGRDGGWQLATGNLNRRGAGGP